MSRNNSRINKYRKYREKIDSNENIHLSIINSDEKFKEILNSINFDIEEHYNKTGILNNSIEYKEIKRKDILKELEEKLYDIEKTLSQDNESSQKTNLNSFNSHKNDQLIKEYFHEFINEKELELEPDSEQETTDLKIFVNKIKN